MLQVSCRDHRSSQQVRDLLEIIHATIQRFLRRSVEDELFSDDGRRVQSPTRLDFICLFASILRSQCNVGRSLSKRLEEPYSGRLFGCVRAQDPSVIMAEIANLIVVREKLQSSCTVGSEQQDIACV